MTKQKNKRSKPKTSKARKKIMTLSEELIKEFIEAYIELSK
jgi:hypothetical protein